jgi:hypothetical protein
MYTEQCTCQVVHPITFQCTTMALYQAKSSENSFIAGGLKYKQTKGYKMHMAKRPVYLSIDQWIILRL